MIRYILDIPSIGLGNENTGKIKIKLKNVCFFQLDINRASTSV